MSKPTASCPINLSKSTESKDSVFSIPQLEDTGHSSKRLGTMFLDIEAIVVDCDFARVSIASSLSMPA